MFKINPYRPGAGLKPMYIAGRDEDIESVEQIFEALTMNVPVQSIIYSGLRGVGKTVLINKLEEIANEKEVEGECLLHGFHPAGGGHAGVCVRH